MSSPRLNSVAKKAQRQLVQARQAAFDQTIGQTVSCAQCGADFVLTIPAYRGIAVRDRIRVEAVRYACPLCGFEQAITIDDPNAG